MKVNLRKRLSKKTGLISLYLEYYNGYSRDENGKMKHDRSYEYLDLYLKNKPKNLLEKQENKDTLDIAEKVLRNKKVEIDSGRFNIKTNIKAKSNILSYFENIVSEKKKSTGNYGNWERIF